MTPLIVTSDVGPAVVGTVGGCGGGRRGRRMALADGRFRDAVMPAEGAIIPLV